MGIISNIYSIIFLPLISSILCQAFNQKKLSFLITLSCCIAITLLSIKSFFDVLIYEKILNDFELSPVSIALEFRLDIISAIFLLLVIFLKTLSLIFYKDDISKSLNQRNESIFYSVFLLHLFAIIGIFTSNNLINLFIFLEIYSFAFFAILSISQKNELLKLSLRHFYLQTSSSLIILFCFLTIYLTLGELNFDKISENLSLISQKNSLFLKALFFLLLISFILKFFPLWLYFKKLKSSELIANFLSIDSLFIKTNIGIFLALKFIYFFFGTSTIFNKFDFAPILLFLALSLIFYSAIKLHSQKHLKLIATYSCLNNLGFIFAAISLQKVESLQAAFFYLLNFNLINFFIFIFASFLKKNFFTSSINKIWLIRENNLSLLLPLKLLVFFIAGFPLTILFFANWNIAYSSFSLGFETFLLIALLISNFVYAKLGIKIISSFFYKNNLSETEEIPAITGKKYIFYLTSFWLLAAGIYSSFILANFTNSVSLRFASYLLSRSL